MVCILLLGPEGDKTMIWDQSRKSTRPEFDQWQELTDEGEEDMRMQYSTLVHYDPCPFPHLLGDFAEFFNRVSRFGDTVAVPGDRVNIRGFNAPGLYDFRFACKYLLVYMHMHPSLYFVTYYITNSGAIKSTRYVEANIPMITFLCHEANDNVIAPIEFHKIIFMQEPESKVGGKEIIDAMQEKVRVYLDKSVKEDGRLGRLTPFKVRMPEPVELTSPDVHATKKQKRQPAPKVVKTVVKKGILLVKLNAYHADNILLLAVGMSAAKKAKALENMRDTETYDDQDWSVSSMAGSTRGGKKAAVGAVYSTRIDSYPPSVSTAEIQKMINDAVLSVADRNNTPNSRTTASDFTTSSEKKTDSPLDFAEKEMSSCFWFYNFYFHGKKQKWFPSWQHLYDKHYMKFCANEKVMTPINCILLFDNFYICNADFAAPRC